MVSKNTLSIVSAFALQAILTVKAVTQASPEVSCRGVLFDSTGQDGSQPVWPLDTCINLGSESSTLYSCEEWSDYAIVQQVWNASDCYDGAGDHQSEAVMINATEVVSDGCKLTNPCAVAVVNEYVWVGEADDYSCAISADPSNQMHLPDVTVALDECWYDNKQQSYVKITCEANGEATGFGYDLTWAKYTSETCETVDGTSDTIDGTGNGCFDNMEDSPYFEEAECIFPSPVYETECRSVSTNNNIVWAIDECLDFEVYANGETMSGSQMYSCDENEDLYRQEWNTSNCEGDYSEIQQPTVGINAHGCSRSKPCDLIRFDEYLNSKGADGTGDCVKNEQGENNQRVTGALVANVCSLNEQGTYMKVTCDVATGTVTYAEYPDEGCNGAVDEQFIVAGQCLDIEVNAYFESVSCDFTSPVYETGCASVWQNDGAVWPMNSCFTSQSSYGYSSSKYVCDGNGDIWQEKYDGFADCDNEPTETRRPTDINAYECDESLPDCAVAIFDEYLNSESDAGECEKNDDTSADDYGRVQGAIVLNVCTRGKDGYYWKARCEAKGESESMSGEGDDFDYKLIYEKYGSSMDCSTDPDVQVIKDQDCLDIEVQPWFASLECEGAESAPTTMPTEVPIDVGGGANSIKNNLGFVWVAMCLVNWIVN